MKVLSIDVGIKNMAICLMDTVSPVLACTDNGSHNRILKWDIVNLSQPIDLKCCGRNKEGEPCISPVKFAKECKHYCLKHSKKQEFHAPHRELEAKSISKQKLQKLYELADKYGIKYDNPIKKATLISLFHEYTESKCFNNVEIVNSSKMDLITVGRNIKIKLDILFQEDFDSIDAVIIENQISPIANRMKTIQGMITQYFIIRSPRAQIEFISAANKLKDDGVHKETKYSERKKMGIVKCMNLFADNVEYATWESFFKKHSKKDDLSDSLLQLLWYLEKHHYNTPN